MNKLRKKPLNMKVARQIEILQKYYDIDVDNRVINFVLYYEKASDILVNDVTTLGDAPRFNNDVLRRVSEILDSFPVEFKVNLSLQIDDYEGYHPDALLESLKDALEMFNYAVYRDKGLRWLMSAIMVFVSMTILYLRLFAGDKGLINTEGMLYEMLDIIAWVFLWQAVTIMFLTPNEYRSISFKIMRRLLSVSFLDKDKNTLVKAESNKLEEEWLHETKREKVGRIFMLIAGTAYITIAVWNFVDIFTNISSAIGSLSAGDNFGWVDFIFAGIALVSVVIYAIGGIGAISTHCGKGPFRRAVKVFAVLSFLAVALDLGVLIYGEYMLLQAGLPFDAPSMLHGIIEITVSVFYFLGYIFARRANIESSSLTEEYIR